MKVQFHFMMMAAIISFYFQVLKYSLILSFAANTWNLSRLSAKPVGVPVVLVARVTPHHLLHIYTWLVQCVCVVLNNSSQQDKFRLLLPGKIFPVLRVYMLAAPVSFHSPNTGGLHTGVVWRCEVWQQLFINHCWICNGLAACPVQGVSCLLSSAFWDTIQHQDLVTHTHTTTYLIIYLLLLCMGFILAHIFFYLFISVVLWIRSVCSSCQCSHMRSHVWLSHCVCVFFFFFNRVTGQFMHEKIIHQTAEEKNNPATRLSVKYRKVLVFIPS